MKLFPITSCCLATLAGCRADPERVDARAIPELRTMAPPGYRDWRLISVAREEGTLDDVRAILGNDVAIEAFRRGTIPFPDGAAIARIAWSYVPLEESAEVFGQAQSFVSGEPKNGVQFMVKDSRRYPATGGWGFAQFDEGVRPDEAMHGRCFPCHEHVAARDLVFSRYAH